MGTEPYGEAVMIVDLNRVKIFVRPGITDMRKQINGLAIIAESVMNQRPFSGNVFLFCGRTRTVIKVLYWDLNGFCLWMKRLEKDRFPWPEDDAEAREIDRDQVLMLLREIDFWREHRRLTYSTVL
jgi:transposase